MIRRLFNITVVIMILSTMAWAAEDRQRTRQESLNHFCDKILAHLKENVLNRSGEFITVSGFGPYGTGLFFGLSTIRRHGHATARGSNRTIEMTAILGDRTHLSYPCHISVFRRNICGRVMDFYFKGFTIYFTFKVRLEDGTPQLNVCDVSNLGKVTLRQEGSIFGPVIKWMGSWVILLIKSRVARNLEDILCNVVASNF